MTNNFQHRLSPASMASLKKARYDNSLAANGSPADGEYYQNLTPVTGHAKRRSGKRDIDLAR